MTVEFVFIFTIQNRSSDENMEPKEMYCVMGCNDAQSRYFRWLRTEVGIPRAPALVPDTLNATSLTLEWEIPPKLIDLTLGRSFVPKSYLVQWRYEEVDGDWKFCRNQSMGRNSTVRVDNLQPYTRYRVRMQTLATSSKNLLVKRLEIDNAFLNCVVSSSIAVIPKGG